MFYLKKDKCDQEKKKLFKPVLKLISKKFREILGINSH